MSLAQLDCAQEHLTEGISKVVKNKLDLFPQSLVLDLVSTEQLISGDQRVNGEVGWEQMDISIWLS